MTTAAAMDRYQSLAGAQARPVVWWAAVGALFVALDIYVLSAWMLSDKFVPTSPGTQPVPGYTSFFVNLFQVIGGLLAVAAIFWIIRDLRRQGSLSAYSVIVLGWCTAVWQDPLDNYLRPVFGYSSLFVNYGSWSEFIPGWISPNGSKMPEPVFFTLGNYLLVMPIAALIVAWLLRMAKRRMPQLNTLQLVAIAIVGMILYDFVLEVFWVRTGMYAYFGGIDAVTINAGKPYQFPIYVSLTWGPVLGLVGALYFFRDDKGNMLVERGIENVKAEYGKSLLRVLAVGGFINIAFLIYSLIYIFLTLQVDPWPANMPDHLRNGLCGRDTQYECPGPDVHIAQKGAGPLLPFTGRN